jgi:ribonuclease D
MLAARLLGLRQFSLSHLVQAYLGAKLEKGPQKANWAVRPLTERMERYARNDTHYLKPLADRLRTDLDAKERLEWHRESCARLIADSAQPREIDLDFVWRLRGSHLLSRAGLAVLRELWQWREREAVAANRPPFFILSHDLLVSIAAASVAERPVAPLLPKHMSERRRCGLAQAVARGLGISPEEHPKILRSVGRRPTEVQRKRFLELQTHRDARATELDIDPTLIASRATLSDLAHNWEAHVPDLMNWQKQLLSPNSH